MRREVIHVYPGQSWHLKYRGQCYGAFESEDAAIATARSWANNARMQGHQVVVSIGDTSSEQTGAAEAAETKRAG